MRCISLVLTMLLVACTSAVALELTEEQQGPWNALEEQVALDMKLYIKECLSVRDVAAALECSKDAVHRGLKKFGIATRSNASRSRLRAIPLEDLEFAVRKKGLRGAARDLGVNHSTLRHHMMVRRGQK